jgi:DNA-binding NarL/FixJ family response regulator
MRVLIVASDGPSAEAVRRALRYAPTCRVIGWADARRACNVPIAAARPDVVIVDGAADSTVALARAREIRDVLADVKIVLLTDELEPDALATIAAAGINAAVAKSASPASVGMLVREVAADNVFHFAPGRAAPQRLALAAKCLTTRELEILRLAAAGLSNRRIASELWVTEQTVKFHLSNVYRKLGLANRTAAAHYAHLHGLVAADGAVESDPDTILTASVK